MPSAFSFVCTSFTVAADIDEKRLELARRHGATECVNAADPDALFIFGATFDDRLEDEIVVTVIATGFEEQPGSNPPPESRKRDDRDTRSPGRRQEPAPSNDDDPFQEIFRIFDRRR